MRRLLLCLFLLLLAKPAAGQTVTIQAIDPGSGVTVNVGNASDNSLRANIVNSTIPVTGTVNVGGGLVGISNVVTVTNLDIGHREDDPHVTGDYGVPMLGRRVDAATPSSSAGTAGDYTLPSIDENGLLLTNCISGCGGGVQYDEDSVSANAEKLTMAGVVRMDTASPLGANGDRTELIVDFTNRLWVNTEMMDSFTAAAGTANPTTAGVIAFMMLKNGATWDPALPATELANDVAMTIGTTTGSPVMFRASAAAPANVSADNDAVHPWALRSGALAIQPTYGGVLATQLANDAAITIGTTAGDLLMYRASAAAPTNVSADNDAVHPWALRSGAAVIQQSYAGNLAVNDPCLTVAKTTSTFSLVARSVIIPAASAKKNYICGVKVQNQGTTETVSLVEGTGTTCQTGTVAIDGSTTAANGNQMAANGGWVWVAGGYTALSGTGTNVDTCAVPSGANRFTVTVTWVQQ